MIETADGTPIAHMDRKTGNGTSPTERDQNAHLIVDACNAYDLEQATHEETTAELARVEYSLSDIREVLKLYPTDPAEPHAYVTEKLEERDKLLTRWTALEKKLEKLEKAAAAQYENPAGTLEGHRAAMQVLKAAETEQDPARDNFSLYIDLENDAMQAATNQTIADMLTELAERIRSTETGNSFRIKDYNGNTVGNADIIKTFK